MDEKKKKVLKIILNAYREGSISEEDVISMLELFFENQEKTVYYPLYPTTPTITWEKTPDFTPNHVYCTTTTNGTENIEYEKNTNHTV